MLQYPISYNLFRLCGATVLSTYRVKRTESNILSVHAGLGGSLLQLCFTVVFGAVLYYFLGKNSASEFLHFILIAIIIFALLQIIGAMKMVILGASYTFDSEKCCLLYDDIPIASLSKLQQVFVNRRYQGSEARSYNYFVVLKFSDRSELRIFRTFSEDKAGALANEIVNSLKLPFDYREN